jgi:hypothetical protein
MNHVIDTQLDGNRSVEMLEWCELNYSPDDYHVQQLDVIQVSHSSPSLYKWRWYWKTTSHHERFCLMWPFTYQINIVLADSGDGVNNRIFKSNAKTWDQPDVWRSWASQVCMPFETMRVATQGSWLYTMGEPIPNKFDVRYLRFASEDDATQFGLIWL